MTFVVSLHINRCLCRDNVQHIVPTILHPCAHECIDCCACVCVLLILNQSEGHLIISLFQKGSAGAFQVSWAGIPEQQTTRKKKKKKTVTAKQRADLLCCHLCRKEKKCRKSIRSMEETVLYTGLQYVFMALFGFKQQSVAALICCVKIATIPVTLVKWCILQQNESRVGCFCVAPFTLKGTSFFWF